ncbi:NAD-dependent epimerase/dehydratase family protein [Nitrincola sp. MINF-07-Sa-05]|uniref:NAD-dependent epimerase/dehydratase family protein n=1 Tax=Nitrincola salilacus TaxID=3400273 RepID=UPI0039181687
MIDTILITGAKGGVASLMRPMLHRIANNVRLSDISSINDLSHHEESVVADLANYADVKRAVLGADLILHLGGVSTEQSWDDIFPANIIGVHNLYRAALNCNKPRIIFASSNHTVGAYRCEENIDANAIPKPDSYYGVSKVFGEAVARMYYEKYGIETAIVRIGSCFEQPTDPRMLSTWLSPNDFFGLISRIAMAKEIGCPIIYGRSNNSKSFWDNCLISNIGWIPEDNAEVYESIIGSPEQVAKAKANGLMDFHGGLWLREPLKNITD